ncbi:hypothetical protein [uncultured Jatrophihabitans sp.]|uniref:hypothetical protein n=1 Tax=uncultured Jatrophihabitans sp. TaxID=1610747 RepID=UPI0035C9A45F
MIEFLLDALTDLLPGPKRQDEKDISRKGTVVSAFRTRSGVQQGVTQRWATFSTAITDRHLRIGPTSVIIDSVQVSALRPRSEDERISLDPDFVVVRLKTIDGAELEWAIRGSAVDEAVQRLGAVAVY